MTRYDDPRGRSPFLLPRFLDFCISFIKSVYCLFCWYVCTHIHTSSIIRLPTFPLIFSIFHLSFPFSSISFSAYIQHQPSPCFCVYVLFVGLICKSRILIYCWYSFAVEAFSLYSSVSLYIYWPLIYGQ